MNRSVKRIRSSHTRQAILLVSAVIAFLAPIGPTLAFAQVREDILIADFEGQTYGAWRTTGSAFGPGPAHGTLPGQMEVSGFQGKGLVNSFHGGDESTGTLRSPPFEIKRPYLSFLVGGGMHAGETCMELFVEGKPVRAATGPNDRPGGSEHLEWSSWNVTEFLGQAASLRITDSQKGGWGHINIDQIVQSDTKRGIETIKRDLVLHGRYFHLPVKRDAPPRQVKFMRGSNSLSVFEIRLPEAGQAPDFWVFIEQPPIREATYLFEARLPAGSKALELIAQSEEPPDAEQMYREKDRPQLHFTSRRGWLNDPNGLVWHEGKYHLFYQHNPYGWEWGNMHWGHAMSPDLLHWTELPQAISPREFGDRAFSGSAVVGREGTLKDRLVAAFTSTGRGECIGTYEPGPQLFSEYPENPVVKHQGRDPKLLWHKASNRWVMAVYDEFDGKQWIAFYSSPDLKQWSVESRIEGFFECPDLFELPVSGKPGESRWVLYAADGAYSLGLFDGKKFTPDSKQKQRVWYGNFYAAQTFNDTPDGRRIQIGWGNGITFPGMPFNQQLTIPCELTLHLTAEGIRMFARPVAELSSLHGQKHSWLDVAPSSGENPLAGITGDLFEIHADAQVGSDGTLTFTARGVPIVYDAGKKTLTCGDKTAPLSPEGGKISLQILVDRGSIEVFGNNGRVAISHGVIPPEANRAFSVFVTGGATRIQALEVYELKSVWR
jgi:fructan beta-fructosidase